MLAAVRALRQEGRLVGILSDQTDWLDRLDARDRFFGCFDRVYNSYHLGKGKRDPSVFTDVVRDLGIEPALALFIDDQLRPRGSRPRGGTAGVRLYRREGVPGGSEAAPGPSSAPLNAREAEPQPEMCSSTQTATTTLQSKRLIQVPLVFKYESAKGPAPFAN